MTSNDLRPASAIARQYGVKALVFGPPGQGKTPVMLTAPRPVACLIEPGFASIRKTNLPMWVATEYARLDEFVTWATQSKDARNFDTFFFDSGSQAAQNIEETERPKHKDGRKMFYQVQIQMWALFNRMYMAQNAHVVMIAKETTLEDGRIVPMFPSKKITRDMTHLFDLNARFCRINFGGTPTACFQCLQGYDLHMEIRSRYGETMPDGSYREYLSQYEPPNYQSLFNKAMEL